MPANKPATTPILLDTCAVITLALEGADHIVPATRALLEDEKTVRYVSTLSIQEIAQKVNRQRLALTEDLLDQILDDLSATILPYGEKHSRRLFGLPLHAEHADPIDRMLICTALVENIPIVTSDRFFSLYNGVKVIPL